jgi:hypothetical protein
VKPRLYGIDILRLLSFAAITTHHISWVYFYTLDIPVSPDSAIVAFYEYYSRTLAFSGFTIVALTTFLMGLRGKSSPRQAKLLLLLIAGWALFSFFLVFESAVVLPWDVYPLLFVGLLVLRGAESLGPIYVRALSIAGFVMLWIPFWKFQALESLPKWIKHAIVGDCAIDVAEWAVLPWMGLVWAGYGAGFELRRAGRADPDDRWRLGAREAALWAVGLAASLTRWGAYFHTPLGEGFACHVYRQPALTFWSHLLWPIACVRASFDPRVQGWLGKLRGVRWISGLTLSRKFWLAYLVHYPLAYFMAGLYRALGASESEHYADWIALAAVIFLPFIEIVCRLVVSTLEWLQRFSSRRPIRR